MEFVAADYVVFIAVLLVPLAMALVPRFRGGRQITTEEYLMGNR